MNIHMIGDSHILIYEEFKIPNLILHHFAGATAYNLPTKIYMIEEIIFNEVKGDDKLIFNFGSIDCRIHIYNQSLKQHLPVSYIINQVILKYLSVLIAIISKYKVGVYGIIPERQENIYQKEFYLEDKERAFIYKNFNDKLKTICSLFNIPYFDMYNIPDLIDHQGLINLNYTTDGVHVDPIKFPVLKNYFYNWINWI